MPGSERGVFRRTLGTYTYQSVSLLGVEVTAARTRRWCETVRESTADETVMVLPTTDLHREELVEALVDRCSWQHASCETDPVDLVEIPNGLTARLLDT